MELGDHLIELAKKHNVKIIVDGTNLDDLGDYRPQGILDARQEFDGLSNTDNPTDFAVSLISDFEKFVSTKGL